MLSALKSFSQDAPQLVASPPATPPRRSVSSATLDITVVPSLQLLVATVLKLKLPVAPLQAARHHALLTAQLVALSAMLVFMVALPTLQTIPTVKPVMLLKQLVALQLAAARHPAILTVLSASFVTPAFMEALP